MEENEVVASETTESSAPESAPSEQFASQGIPAQSAAEAQAITDLDKLEKFSYQGRQYTPKEFRNQIDVGGLRMQDYTRKMQEMGQERKYSENLNADLASVRAGRATVEQFKAVYPEKFHAFLEYVSQNSAQTQEPQKPAVDPSFLRDFEELRSDMNERKVQAAEAHIDNMVKTFAPKYPFADDEAVFARAQHKLNQKLESEGNKAILNDADWEECFKSAHERNQKVAQKFYSNQANKQKTANLKGSDVPSGGGIPGQAPKMPKNIREASKFALEEMQNS